MDEKRVVHNIEPEDFTKSSTLVTVSYEVTLANETLKSLIIDKACGEERGYLLNDTLLHNYERLRNSCEEFVKTFDNCKERIK